MNGAPDTVSVVIPVHNGGRFLAETLRSVMAQTRLAEEILVVDDGSTDGTADLAARICPQATLIRQTRQGVAAARNAGAARACGAALSFIDHDDLWPPERNAVLLGAWQAAPTADLVCGRFQLLTEPGVAEDARLRRAERATVPFLTGAGMVRRATFFALGGMDGARQLSEDIDFYLRLVEAGGTVARIDAVTLHYRMHGSNASRANDDAAPAASALLDTLRAAAARRRR